jgi:MazG family protein
VALAEALLELQGLAERLRRECPWDRQQTAITIVPHTVEEAYEVADAALAGDAARLVDELGDLLYQTFFLALLLSERGQGDLEQVARSVQAKLVRRHPHVFGQEQAASAGAVRRRWEELKAQEEGREGLSHHLPGTLPALLYARKAQRRAAALGLDYPSLDAALGDLRAELAELEQALAETPPPAAETEPHRRQLEEVGDLLFACVNVARLLNVDPELALRGSAERFLQRLERAQALARAEGVDLARLPLAEQDRYYHRAKHEEVRQEGERG